MKVAIVTDTSACLPQELAQRYQIEIVPMEFLYEGKVYRDGIDMTSARFYELLSQAKKLPTTSAPSPDTYVKVFRKISQRSSNILVIAPSARFTHAFDSARAAAAVAREDMPNVVVEVLDCGTAAGAQGLIVLAAARAAAEGGSLSQTVEATRSLMPQVHLVALLDTLHYLAKSGRVPHAVAWANFFLRIKPIFELQPLGRGAIPVGRVRTRSKAIEQLMMFLKERADRKSVHAVVMHTNVLDEAERLKERVTSEFKCQEIYVTDFTPVMGLHAGPGLLGIAFHSEESDPGSKGDWGKP